MVFWKEKEIKNIGIMVILNMKEVLKTGNIMDKVRCIIDKEGLCVKEIF